MKRWLRQYWPDLVLVLLLALVTGLVYLSLFGWPRQAPAVTTVHVTEVETPVEAQSWPLAWSVFYSPRGGCTDAVVHQIGKAKKEVLVQAYNFSSDPITEALVAAHHRGVDVRIVIDHVASTEKSCTIAVAHKAGVPVWVDSKHKIAHNKVMVIDGRVVLTGSFNWSEAAEDHNAENLLILPDPALAKLYKANWEAHCEHSEKMKR